MSSRNVLVIDKLVVILIVSLQSFVIKINYSDRPAAPPAMDEFIEVDVCPNDLYEKE